MSDHHNLLPFGVSQLWDFEIIGIVVNALGGGGGGLLAGQVIRKVGSHCLGGAIHLQASHASTSGPRKRTDPCRCSFMQLLWRRCKGKMILPRAAKITLSHRPSIGLNSTVIYSLKARHGWLMHQRVTLNK